MQKQLSDSILEAIREINMTDLKRMVMLAIINNPGKSAKEIHKMTGACYERVYHFMNELMPEGKPCGK